MVFRTSHLPVRAATGAFILNAGISHLDADDETVKGVHSMAADAYPVFRDMDPRTFVRLLGAGEVVLGAALVVPLVSSGLAGAGLGVFSGALLGMYARTPRMHEEGSLRPTQEGLAMAKDSWMAGIATALMVDHVASRLARGARARARRAERARRRAAVFTARTEGQIAGARKAAGVSALGVKKAAKGTKKAGLGTASAARKATPAMRWALSR